MFEKVEFASWLSCQGDLTKYTFVLTEGRDILAALQTEDFCILCVCGFFSS